MSKKVIIIGAGGHGKVIADIIIKSGDNLIGFLDDNKVKDTNIIQNYKIIGKIDDCIKMQLENPDLQFIIAIGNNDIRKNISEKYKLNYYIAIHPNAIISLDVKIEEGTVIMASSCINASTQIGKHCIINTGAVIEHDNVIEDYVHISPNVALGGTVKVGKNTHIGIGATVKNNVDICEKCLIGAGALVIKDIKEEGIFIGVPSKKMRK